MAAGLDVEKCRAGFPGLNSADYSLSVLSTKRSEEGFASTARLFNAKAPSEVTLGHSSTNLTESLARAIEPTIKDGDEIIVSDADHEANVGSWVRLAERKGIKLHHWIPKASPGSTNSYAVSLRIDDLIPLLNPKTRLVAFTACSNILGELVNVEGITKAIRERTKSENNPRGAEVCIDCVAYAPHRRMDAQKWDVDYIFFSYYKASPTFVYGPHSSALYTRAESHRKLTSLAHYFLPVHEGSPYKLQPGGNGYERSYSVTAVLEYLESIGGGDLGTAFDRIAEHEGALMRPLMECLLSPEMKKRGIRVLGPETADPKIRAPTISFVVQGETPIRSPEVVKQFDVLGDVGIRFGHFYAHRLFTRLGLNPDDGAVRISLVHYNTVAEAERLADRLKQILLS
ncbi:aminotransferase class-V protein [Ceratobasidium sp. AG-Ba]|nr:aminotransferase class-V protein [Ceratobasidium sp. AG-Ba]